MEEVTENVKSSGEESEDGVSARSLDSVSAMKAASE
jgi:hypothetical protein